MAMMMIIIDDDDDQEDDDDENDCDEEDGDEDYDEYNEDDKYCLTNMIITMIQMIMIMMISVINCITYSLNSWVWVYVHQLDSPPQCDCDYKIGSGTLQMDDFLHLLDQS